MAAEGIGEHGAEGVVVDVAVTVVGGAGVAQVALERLACAQRQHVDQTELVLVVEVVQAAVVVARVQPVVPLVGKAGEIEGVTAGLATDNALGAGGGDRHFLVVRGVALVDPIHAPGIDAQAFDLLDVQLPTAECLRQQARVIGQQHRQLRGQGAELEHAVGRFELGRQAQFAILVLGAFGRLVIALEQAGAGAIGTGIELDAELAKSVDTDADHAVGIAGFVAQKETLGPFFLLGLGGIGLAEVAVEVEVARFQPGRAVCEEVGVSLCGEAGAGQEQGEGGGFHWLPFVVFVVDEPLPRRLALAREGRFWGVLRRAAQVGRKKARSKGADSRSGRQPRKKQRQ
ncbi:hypothetical protein D3C86_1175740 [compost metagenome]